MSKLLIGIAIIFTLLIPTVMIVVWIIVLLVKKRNEIMNAFNHT